MIERRLTLGLLAGLALIATVDAIAGARRSLALHDRDARAELRAAGQLLQDAALAVYRQGGEAAVHELARNAGERLPGTEVRWVWLDAPPDSARAPRIDARRLAGVAAGRYVEIERDEPGGARRYLYAPAHHAERAAALELARSLRGRDHLVRAVVAEQAVGVAAELVVLALLSTLLLSRRVGGPLRRLGRQVELMVPGQPAQRPLASPEAAGEVADLARAIERLSARCTVAVEQGAADARRRMADVTELHTANRLVTVGKLAAAMAHELGTPLGVVHARAQMLVGDDLAPAQVREDARAILEQSHRMEQMIREVLDLARPHPPSREPVDLAALVRHAVTMMAPLARKHEVTLRLDEPAVPARVRGDASRLLQILTNLVINASQAMPAGGEVRVAIERRRARAPGATAELEVLAIDVRDHGVGIQADQLGHVFDTFFTTKEDGEGTGLGLAVSYRIAREHGGWIGVDSQPGRGSCFTVYLPPA